MNDKLEKFIKTQRAAFDDKEPPSQLWDNIAGVITPETKIKPISRPLIYWRVAAVILFFITSALLVDKYIETESKSADVAIDNKMLLEAEGYYLSLINDKKQEITAYGDSNYGDQGFREDINTLDSVYQALKSELIQGNEQDIVDAMIQNLQLRIDILNQQLEIIQSIEKIKRQNNETIHI